MKWEEVWGGAYLKDHAAAPRTVHCPCSDEKVIIVCGHEIYSHNHQRQNARHPTVPLRGFELPPVAEVDECTWGSIQDVVALILSIERPNLS